MRMFVGRRPGDREGLSREAYEKSPQRTPDRQKGLCMPRIDIEILSPFAA
jgi:hypothetical protein